VLHWSVDLNSKLAFFSSTQISGQKEALTLSGQGKEEEGRQEQQGRQEEEPLPRQVGSFIIS